MTAPQKWSENIWMAVKEVLDWLHTRLFYECSFIHLIVGYLCSPDEHGRLELPVGLHVPHVKSAP